MIKTSQSKVANTFTYESHGCALVDSLMKEGRTVDAHRLCCELFASTGKASLLINRAMVERSIGCYRLSLATLETVRTDDLLLLGNLHNGLALSCWGLKRFDDALIHYYGAADFYEQAGHDFYAARVQNNIANCLIDLARPEEAHEHLDRAEKVLTDKASLGELHDTRSRAFKAQVNTE